MLSHNAKIVISCLLSLLGVFLWLRRKSRIRMLCMIAMLLSTVGDLFMVDAFRMGSVSTYPGAAFFMAAHIVNGICFLRASKAKAYEFVNRGLYTGILVTDLAAVLLGILAFSVPEDPEALMYCLILVYVAVIGWNLASQFSYACSEGGRCRFLYAAMGLFLLSDFIVFLPMLNIRSAMNDLVWATYIPAQLLILLFCDALPAKARRA